MNEMTRQEQLDTWLHKIGAVNIATVKGPNKSELRFYAVIAHVFIVQIFRNAASAQISWDLYIPASPSQEIAATFEAAERYFGLAEGSGDCEPTAATASNSSAENAQAPTKETQGYPKPGQQRSY